MSFRYDPFEQMDRLFEQTRRAMHDLDAGRPDVAAGPTDVISTTEANVGLEPTDEGYVVTADLPGFEKEDLVLRFEDGVLSITGHVDVTEEGEGRVHRRRRSVNEQVAVPGTVVEDEIDASYRNGVLEVHLPVEAESGEDARRIEID